MGEQAYNSGNGKLGGFFFGVDHGIANLYFLGFLSIINASRAF